MTPTINRFTLYADARERIVRDHVGKERVNFL